jgi:putative PIN family toxin of toxin-antitoxin system
MKVIFDTNVVASASCWRGAPFDCLAAWAEGRCGAAVSPALLAEYHETTGELRAQYPDRPFVPWANALAESAALVFPTENARGATLDPDDAMVLECALAAGADCLVSGDKRHLLRLKAFRGIPIVNPTDFLRRLAVSK